MIGLNNMITELLGISSFHVLLQLLEALSLAMILVFQVGLYFHGFTIFDIKD
jgi:hypothetical protein